MRAVVAILILVGVTLAPLVLVHLLGTGLGVVLGFLANTAIVGVGGLQLMDSEVEK